MCHKILGYPKDCFQVVPSLSKSGTLNHTALAMKTILSIGQVSQETNDSIVASCGIVVKGKECFSGGLRSEEGCSIHVHEEALMVRVNPLVEWFKAACHYCTFQNWIHQTVISLVGRGWSASCPSGHIHCTIWSALSDQDQSPH